MILDPDELHIDIRVTRYHKYGFSPAQMKWVKHLGGPLPEVREAHMLLFWEPNRDYGVEFEEVLRTALEQLNGTTPSPLP